ncbi:hypothetical protein M408DRAFT_29547 [Serendipita vermifera MAFF 305830]|uniref:Uncharacterized protein n=1 Tax=Serendipita vermifera MAFF 305830 TaxID=933852 RepID=A0A0C2W4T0_SERVB|nr:hypothetical protein M408DRAFT_29547 [Serendipita vermifera MAFF 305830]
MSSQHLVVAEGEFITDCDVEVTETVTETIIVTETIEYIEVDGVIQIVGRDVEVEDVVEVVQERRHLEGHGHFRDIMEITESSENVLIEGSSGQINESRLIMGAEETTRIVEVDETRECGRITEVAETETIQGNERIDMSVEMETDTLFYGRHSGVKAITAATEVTETREIDINARASMLIGWNYEQSAQPRTSTLIETTRIEEVIEQPQQSTVNSIEFSQQSDVNTTQSLSLTTQTREVVEIDEDLELEADKTFVYTGWELTREIEEPRSPTVAHGTQSTEVVKEPVTVYQQRRPTISHSTTNGSMMTLHHTQRSSYSESTAPGASTDGFFKPSQAYPPVPPLPAAYANRTLVNLDMAVRTGCTGQCRTTTIDQARRLLEVTAISKKSSFKPFFRILLLATFVTLLTLGIAAVLIGYIWAGKIEANYWQITTAVPQGSVLLITTFATKVIIICIPFLLAIMAYYIATAWAMRNASVTQVERRDCGCVVTRTADNQTTVIANEEYGLLLGMLKGATIFTLWSTIRYYLFKSTSSSQRKAASRPLIQGFSVLLMALLILYCVMGLDFALHHVSSTDYIPVKGPAIPAALLPSSNTALYSRALKPECLSPNANGTACTVTTQTVLGIPAFNTTTSFQIGLQTLAGLSSDNYVATAPFQRSNGSYGEIALLVDNSHPVDEAFTAITIGVHTQCELISPYCDMTTDCDANHSPPTTHPNITARHPTCTGFSCSKPEWPIYWDEGMTNGTNFFLSEPLELRNDSALYSLQAPPSYLATDLSTFRFFTSLASYVDPSTLQNVCTQWSATGVCVKGSDDGYVYSSQTPIEPTPFYRKLITACTVSIVNVEYEHFDGKYTIRQETAQPADNSTALALSSVLYTTDARTTAIGVTLAGLATSNANSSLVASTMETSVSRMMLAMGHAAFEATPAFDVVFTVNVPITILPTPLIIAFVTFLVLFALLTIALAVLALITINKSLWMQRKRVEKVPNGQAGAFGAATTTGATAGSAACESDNMQEKGPRCPPLRSSTMPEGSPSRLYSEKTVVGDDGRVAGYCS